MKNRSCSDTAIASVTQTDASLVPPTPARLFWSFLSIGAFTFGGGYAMLPLIQKSLVEKSKWLKDEEFVDAIAVAQSSPGPIAVNIAVMTGYKLKGLPGALASVLGAVLPSFTILLIIATFFLGVQDNRFVRGALTGMRPAIVALMASAVYDVGKKTIRSRQAAILSIIALLLLTVLQLHPVIVIIIAASAGLALNNHRTADQTSIEVSPDSHNPGESRGDK
ncbi:MAG: chromate transporter [Firmicutes bacterium]|nr:chromate transporter [Bacillota bacterium]